MSELTYRQAGATLRPRLPRGYHRVRYRTPIGDGPEVFDRAAEAVLTFAMHRAAGARVRAPGPRVRNGMRLTVTLGPFTVPCQVVYVLDEPDRRGFGYGTLPGHQVTGEEAFLVLRDPGGGVWLEVVAFSLPARRLAVLGGPVTELLQHGFARLLGRALRRLCAPSRSVGP